MEWDNRYWIKEKRYNVIYVFSEEGLDNMKHVGECVKVKKWFTGLGRNINEGIQKILNDDLQKEKGKTLERLQGRKKRSKKKKKEWSVQNNYRRAHKIGKK